jgi:hypothetical protein
MALSGGTKKTRQLPTIATNAVDVRRLEDALICRRSDRSPKFPAWDRDRVNEW